MDLGKREGVHGGVLGGGICGEDVLYKRRISKKKKMHLRRTQTIAETINS